MDQAYVQRERITSGLESSLSDLKVHLCRSVFSAWELFRPACMNDKGFDMGDSRS